MAEASAGSPAVGEVGAVDALGALGDGAGAVGKTRNASDEGRALSTTAAPAVDVPAGGV